MEQYQQKNLNNMNCFIYFSFMPSLYNTEFIATTVDQELSELGTRTEVSLESFPSALAIFNPIKK